VVLVNVIKIYVKAHGLQAPCHRGN